MHSHPPILIIVPFVVITCYIGWSLIAGSLRIRGRQEPISRQDSPRDYWYHMRIIGVVFAIIVAIIAWMFL